MIATAPTLDTACIRGRGRPSRASPQRSSTQVTDGRHREAAPMIATAPRLDAAPAFVVAVGRRAHRRSARQRKSPKDGT
jgi:hypothetical protein